MPKRRTKLSCPRPDKLRYRSWAAAYHDAAHKQRTMNRQRQIFVPHYAYHCRCGWWHITTHAKHNGQYNDLLLAVPIDLQRWAFPAEYRPHD